MASSTQSFPPAVIAPSVSGQNQIATTPWRRALVPSFSDCFFIALLAWLFVCGANGWKALLMDGDTGWHIRTGEYILAHHAVPTQDLFSFSKAGQQWFAWEWLSDVLYAVLFGIGGLKAIVLFAGAWIAAFATVLLRYAVWRGANGLAAACVCLFAVGGSSMHFLARPHLFTLLLLPACLWLVEADRRKNTPWVWLLIPVTTVWANLHGGFLIFVVCLALLAVGSAAESMLGRPRWPAVRRYTALTAACLAATLVNPYGLALHTHIIQYMQSNWIKDLVQEFQAPTFRSEGQFQYEVLLIGGMVLCGLLLRKQRITETLWLLFLAHASLTSLRHAPLYVGVAAPLIASELSAGWRSLAAGRKKSSVLTILHQLGEDLTGNFARSSVWPVLVIAALVFLDAPLKWPRDFPSEAFPIAMVHENAKLLESGRLLTTDQWGDYIIYCFYPRQKVWIDGRSDFYGESLGTEYLHLLQGAYDWRNILDRQGFDVALLPVNWPLAEMLKLDRSWQVIKDDGHTILFRRLRSQSLSD